MWICVAEVTGEDLIEEMELTFSAQLEFPKLNESI